MEIRRYAHGEGDFWYRMGPFLASAAVRRELGAPISSDENTTWWLAIDDANNTIGFVAAHSRKGVWEFRHDYVVPDARGMDVYRALFRARLEACSQSGASMAKATVNARSLPIYREHGFVPVSQRGQYTVVQKELKAHEPV